MDDIHYLDRLIKVGRELEDNKCYVNNLIPPPLNINAIEVDLEYRREVTNGDMSNLEIGKHGSFRGSQPCKTASEQWTRSNSFRKEVNQIREIKLNQVL